VVEEHAREWTTAQAAAAFGVASALAVSVGLSRDASCEAEPAPIDSDEDNSAVGGAVGIPLTSVAQVTHELKPMLAKVRSAYMEEQCPAVVVTEMGNEAGADENVADGIQIGFTSAPLHSGLMALTAFQHAAQRADPGCHLKLEYRNPDSNQGHILQGELVDSNGNGVCQVST
jgi:ABC-type phosphate transport system substrate-binding protein